MQEPSPTGARGIPQVELPKTLGVVVPPGHDIEPVWNLLVAAGLSPEAGTGRTPVLINVGNQDFEALPDWLNQHPEGHILLLFNAPVPTIAGLMADTLGPTDAVAQWHHHAEQVLAAVRPNRRRMTLIALEAARADPGAFTNLLGDRFGLALKRPIETIEAGENPGAVLRMMAENAVWQSPDVRNLAAELEANALPMPPGHGLLLPAVEEVYSEFNSLVERTRASKEAYKAELEKNRQRLKDRNEENVQDQERKKALEEENELLLQQLHQVQEELETTFQKNRDLSGKLDALEKEKSASAQSSEKLTELKTKLVQAEFELNELRSGDKAGAEALEKEKRKLQAELEQVKRQSDERCKDLEEENELLLQQLHHVQEELESYYLSGTDARHELEEARATIEALYNSKSWKLTRPLRFVLDLFSGHRRETR